MKITAVQRMLESDQNLADDRILFTGSNAQVLLTQALIDLAEAKRRINLLEAKLKISEYTAQRYKNGRTR